MKKNIFEKSKISDSNPKNSSHKESTETKDIFIQSQIEQIIYKNNRFWAYGS